MANDFDNEANLIAYRLWRQRWHQLILSSFEQIPVHLARGSEARELGTSDTLSGLPESLLEGLRRTTEDPESTVRAVVALQRAALEMIMEMLQAHWREAGSALVPP